MANSWTIHSLSRGLRLLDIIAQQSGGITVKWLSAASDIPLGTCYHLVKTLVEEGYVEKDKISQLYKLSYKIAYLHNQMRTDFSVPAPLKLITQDIVTALQETTYVARWEHGEVIIQHITEGNQAVKVRALYVGYREHAFVHALGKTILAHLPSRDLISYRRMHPPSPRTSHSRVDPEHMEHELRLTRERGYSCDLQEWELGVCCVAAPIFQYDGRIWGAVAVSMPESRYDPASLDVPRYIQDQARLMSEHLGLPFPGTAQQRADSR